VEKSYTNSRSFEKFLRKHQIIIPRSKLNYIFFLLGMTQLPLALQLGSGFPLQVLAKFRFATLVCGLFTATPHAEKVI
jgi:hypothetical protein